MKKMYKIELNETQVRLIAKSLEMHSRMRCGQLGESFIPPLQDKIFKAIEKNDEDYHEKRKQLDLGLGIIKKALWPELNGHAHHGIGHDKEADLGYEMYKCILSKFEEELKEKEGDKYSPNVHTGTPLKLTDHPFIKIEKNENKF